MFGRYLSAIAILAACPAPSLASNALDRFDDPTVTQQDWAGACDDWDEWDKPASPFRIHGTIFHVGTCGISAILIADPEGHILIDSGTDSGAEIVLANIRAIGFDPADIALVLHSHEHFDHVGGHAAIRRAIEDAGGKANFAASAAAAEVLRSGRDGPGDPQFGMHPTMQAVPIDIAVNDGETLRTPNLAVTAVATPGHTPGALSWTWQSCEGKVCRVIVYADSLSPVSSDTYRFSDHQDYLAAYRAGIARLAALECDILLTPHPSASGMRDKLLAGDLTSGMNCRDYADAIGRRLDERLAKEAAE